MDDIKEFLPYVTMLFAVCNLACFFVDVNMSITNMILISLAAVPVKIVYDFFKEF